MTVWREETSVDKLKKLIDPNRTGGVSELELRKALKILDTIGKEPSTWRGLYAERNELLARAEAAEAENARLREQVATLTAQLSDCQAQGITGPDAGL